MLVRYGRVRTSSVELPQFSAGEAPEFFDGCFDGRCVGRGMATIYERGNGFPDVGDYVPGSDGNLYKVVKLGRIETGRSPGASNWMLAKVELAEWSDCEDEEEFPALCDPE